MRRPNDLGQDQFVFVLVEDQHLPFPDLVDLAGDDLAHLLRIFLVEAGLLQIEDARREILTQRQHRAAAERRELDLIGILVAHLVGRIDGLHLRDGDLRVGILHLAVGHHRAVAPDFEVALFGVDNHVEVFIRLVLLLQGVAENVLQHADHRALVDVFQLLEFSEVADQIQIIHVALSYFYYFDPST